MVSSSAQVLHACASKVMLRGQEKQAYVHRALPAMSERWRLRAGFTQRSGTSTNPHMPANEMCQLMSTLGLTDNSKDADGLGEGSRG